MKMLWKIGMLFRLLRYYFFLMNDNSISNRSLLPEGINACMTLLTNTKILLILSASAFNAFSLGEEKKKSRMKLICLPKNKIAQSVACLT